MNDDKAETQDLTVNLISPDYKTKSKTRSKHIKTREEDPNDVNGEIEAPILIIDRINSDLERVLKRTKKLCLTHPL
jgi:ribonuclease G